MTLKTIEATGKSVDAAVFNGLKQLEISIDEVTIEVLQHETSGILGIGAKPAKVRLTQKEPEDVVVPDFKELARRDRGDAGRQRDRRERSGDRGERRDRREKPERPERGDKCERPEMQERRERPARAEKTKDGFKHDRYESPEAPKKTEEPENDVTALKAENAGAVAEKVPTPVEINAAESSGDAEQVMSGEERERPVRARRRERQELKLMRNNESIDYTKEAAQNEPGAQFVLDLVRHMGIEADVLACSNDDEVMMRIDGKTQGVLIGRRGETLDAIQYLASLYVNKNRKEDGYKRVMVDTEGYRCKREETLIRLARKVAAQVKATGRQRALEPMNPYERRVMHSALQGNPYVTTHSEGEEPNRRVIVAPKHRKR